MLGLTDPWTARNGLKCTIRAGHQKRASIGHLIDAKASLLIGHPSFRTLRELPTSENYSIKSFLEILLCPQADDFEILVKKRMYAIPIHGGERYLLAIELSQNRSIDSIAQLNGWRRYIVAR